MDPLIVDVYKNDGPKNWQTLAKAGRPWVGAYLKATQGTYYRPDAWLADQWKAVRAAGGSRYGVDWFRGAYHYLDVGKNGTAQADYFLNAITKAGGFGGGDLPPMVDAEAAGQPPGVKAQQVVTCAGDFIYRVREVTGREVMLYAGSYPYDLGIKDRMGAKWLAIARYTAKLPAIAYNRIGWDRKSLGLWQYCGDGEAYLYGYPNQAPGCGRVDISAVVLGWNRLPELINGETK